MTNYSTPSDSDRLRAADGLVHEVEISNFETEEDRAAAMASAEKARDKIYARYA